MNTISNTSATVPSLSPVIDTEAPATRAVATGFSNVDTLEGASPRSPLTPATNAWMDSVENPNLPISERLTNLAVTPIMLPLVVVLDTILLPFTAIANLFKK